MVMNKLLENILNENYISANELFEEKLSEIQEKKLIEMKKCIQAESMSGLTKADIEAKRKAGYVKASEVLPDPRDIDIGVKPKSQKTEPKRKNAVRSAISRVKSTGAGVKQAAQDVKSKALGAISDPISSTTKAIKATGNIAKGAYKNARTSGTKTNTALRYIAGALKSVEEESKPRRKIILRKKSRSNTLRITKDKYNTKATNVAIEE
jgi:hypothetical protein